MIYEDYTKVDDTHLRADGVTDLGEWAIGSIGDNPLPVTLSAFAAVPGDGVVTLRWATASEIDNLGFHLYRALSEEGLYDRITAELVEGAGTSPNKHDYSFTDPNVSNGVTYWYQVEDIAFDGATTLHGPIAITPQAKTEALTAAVTVSSFTAQAEDDGVSLEWITEGKTADLGYFLYRASKQEGVYERLTPEVLTGADPNVAFTDGEVSRGGTYWYMLEMVSSDGTWTKHGPISVTVLAKEETAEVQALPAEFGLSVNVPNPFNPQTTITYQLPKASEVTLIVRNTLGQAIRTLVDDRKEADWYRVVWDGTDDAGKDMASGTYLYELRAGDFLKVRTMVLIR
ncbi:MAG: FlgD immunoglobulin-like domain containing protein [Candidatus Latescibacterota bacterium]